MVVSLDAQTTHVDFYLELFYSPLLSAFYVFLLNLAQKKKQHSKPKNPAHNNPTKSNAEQGGKGLTKGKLRE